MSRKPAFAFLLLVSLLMPGISASQPWDPEALWYSQDDAGNVKINLHFFWSKKCPHCRNALPFVESLSTKHPWLQVHVLELTEHKENVQKYIAMAAMLGEEARSVPAFFWCGQMSVGYDNEQGVGQTILDQLKSCRQRIINENDFTASQTTTANSEITVPILGSLDLQRFSLPTYTVILAGLDAFNPCAFFVLLFLLSLLVHAKNRKKMLLIGGIFVFFSGLLYFLFMAAWLNVFLLIGQINAITYIAGSVAVLMALINIKDYFWFKQGVSLSIPDNARTGLFARMRKIVNSDNSTAMVFAAMGLAAFANIYEFLCTAGFPMVFTRMLTLNNLSQASHYFYLILYNLIYIIPLLTIVILFSITLGAKKLQEKQGKILKLLSGMMMLYLGLLLLLKPNWLNNAGIAVLLLLFALFSTFIVITLERRLLNRGTAT